VQYEGCSTQGDDGTILNEQSFAIAQYAVHHKCAGYALFVAYCVEKVSRIIALHIYDAVAAVHTGIACLNGMRNDCAFIVASEHIVALAKWDYLFVAKGVLYYYNVAEILGYNFILVLANAYCEAFAAVLTLKDQRLAFTV
jgi:hypothetical protein